jgi:hypothetical protein
MMVVIVMIAMIATVNAHLQKMTPSLQALPLQRKQLLRLKKNAHGREDAAARTAGREEDAVILNAHGKDDTVAEASEATNVVEAAEAVEEEEVSGMEVSLPGRGTKTCPIFPLTGSTQ